MGKCNFQGEWLDDEKYKTWLKRVAADKHKAFCTLCQTEMSLSSLGWRALEKHALTKKHSDKEKRLGSMQQQSADMLSFVQRQGSSSGTPSASSDCSVVPPSQTQRTAGVTVVSKVSDCFNNLINFAFSNFDHRTRKLQRPCGF
jgi:hypothetical protein